MTVSNPVDSADQRQDNSKIHVLTDCGGSCITSVCLRRRTYQEKNNYRM